MRRYHHQMCTYKHVSIRNLRDSKLHLPIMCNCAFDVAQEREGRSHEGQPVRNRIWYLRCSVMVALSYITAEASNDACDDANNKNGTDGRKNR